MGFLCSESLFLDFFGFWPGSLEASNAWRGQFGCHFWGVGVWERKNDGLVLQVRAR